MLPGVMVGICVHHRVTIIRSGVSRVLNLFGPGRLPDHDGARLRELLNRDAAACFPGGAPQRINVASAPPPLRSRISSICCSVVCDRTWITYASARLSTSLSSYCLRTMTCFPIPFPDPLPPPPAPARVVLLDGRGPGTTSPSSSPTTTRALGSKSRKCWKRSSISGAAVRRMGVASAEDAAVTVERGRGGASSNHR
jgi:hypothetical protein